MIFRILDESQYLQHVKYYISTQTFSKCHRFFFENDAGFRFPGATRWFIVIIGSAMIS